MSIVSSALNYFVSYRTVFQAELTCRTQDTSELHPRAFLCLVFCLGLEKSPNAKFKWTVNVFQEFFVHRRLWCTYLTLLCTIHGYSMHRVRLDCSTSTGNWFGPNFVLFSNENTFLTQLSSPRSIGRWTSQRRMIVIVLSSAHQHHILTLRGQMSLCIAQLQTVRRLGTVG